MSKIQELSEMLANQIAAGEVVERPASVVKELVENAIDANSSQIDIYIEEAGLRKIQVIDNGDGIDNDDVLSAFKRHATSKIHSRDDLFRIRTLGFRGEALPSIASVSEMTLETSTGEGEGSFVRLAGGKVLEHKPNALRKGTKITVENLFYNTPARLKYVKSLQTELANVGDIINRLAMSHPQIAFRLVHDGNKMLSTTGNGDIKQAIAGIYGVGTAKKMLPIEQEDLDFKISGYVSLPELTRASRNYLSIIINGRYIRNYLLNKAIVEGYGSKLMVGRFPLAVIKIDMDPLLVDVNVHPTKQEVRLSKEQELMTLIASAIQEALSEQQLIPNAASNLGFNRGPKEKKVEQIRMPLETPLASTGISRHQSQRQPTFKEQGLAYDAAEGRFYVPDKESKAVEADLPPERLAEPKERLTPSEPPSLIAEPTAELISETPAKIVDLAQVDDQKFELPFGPEVPEVLDLEMDTQDPAKGRFPELEYFGQMHGTYLFAQSVDGLYIVDQHAAQERIKYEYFREKIGQVGTDLQELLVPIVLDYPNSDVLRIQEHADNLASVGIHLENFGQNSFIVRAHPTWYPSGKEETIIREMIDLVLTTGQASVAKFREDTAIMMSCKQSIKANHYLNEEQARILLEDLAKCENPFNCPHGRPVLIHFNNTDMEKMFKRIQDSH
ncbi:DNA mismatch repair endonuclease MutL [Vagococcus sp. BWB3-3]|uniref:DNA mismatch repair protein MutL n=1 Tax=Vagococcus allomyrinae TaxID=2794353 RepID=A0A940SU96_9ENTE|nr:DNA mismatch repair endonuclease MutL [Vagococcus allomyrinae]